MSSETNKEYSVKWKNHLTHIQKSFDYLLNSNELTDVTLYCEGKKIGAHKILLSACSTYFRDTFKDVPCQHPVIILYGVEYNVLSDILHFIYNGEVSVDTSKLDSFLKTAQLLQISGLTEDSGDRITSESEQPTDTQASDHETEQTYVEPVATPVNEDAKRGVKRPKVKEADTSRDKIVRQDSDTLFISDVKCEPSELVNFEDPLEDPLLQTDPPNDQKFYGTSAGQNTGEEEFKHNMYKRNTAFENNTISVSKQSIYAIEATGRKTNKRKTTAMQKKRSRCYICTGNDNKYRTKCDICHKHICNVHSVCETNTFCIYCEEVE